MLGFNGGLVGASRAAAAGNATGLWLPNEQAAAKSLNQWPLAGDVPVGLIGYSQSSVYGGTAPATNMNMTDGSFINTGAATNADALAWIRMDLGSAFFVDRVVVGTGTNSIPGGWNKSYTENKNVEYSVDGTSWTVAFNTGTFAVNGIYNFSVSFVAQYVRIVAVSTWVIISEFYALSPGQAYPPP
jgi:hypothetical protein